MEWSGYRIGGTCVKHAPVSGCWPLVSGFWFLVSGWRMVVAGCWLPILLLVSGFWLLVGRWSLWYGGGEETFDGRIWDSVRF
jgi:hypothetical protein